MGEEAEDAIGRAVARELVGLAAVLGTAADESDADDPFVDITFAAVVEKIGHLLGVDAERIQTLVMAAASVIDEALIRLEQESAEPRPELDTWLRSSFGGEL